MLTLTEIHLHDADLRDFRVDGEMIVIQTYHWAATAEQKQIFTPITLTFRGTRNLRFSANKRDANGFAIYQDVPREQWDASTREWIDSIERELGVLGESTMRQAMREDISLEQFLSLVLGAQERGLIPMGISDSYVDGDLFMLDFHSDAHVEFRFADVAITTDSAPTVRSKGVFLRLTEDG